MSKYHTLSFQRFIFFPFAVVAILVQCVVLAQASSAHDIHYTSREYCSRDDSECTEFRRDIYEKARHWYIDDSAKEGPCNIPTIDALDLTQDIFVERYAYSTPVIINLPVDWNKVFYSHCEKDTMLSKYGEKIIRLSSANTHSYRKRDVTLRYYVDEVLRPQNINTLGNETFYWFGDNNYTEWEDLFNLYKQPPVSLPGMKGSYSFGMAGAGTGVPFHWHGPGFGEVVFGRKRWFLLPPNQAPTFDPDRTTLYWLMNEYKTMVAMKMPMMECTLRPGQAIYFPDRWWHATLNLDTSIFISTFLGQ